MHKHKRKGFCIISLNNRLGVRQNPFLFAYAIDGTHSFKTCFVRWRADAYNRFYGKEIIKESSKEQINHQVFVLFKQNFYLCKRVVRSSEPQYITELAFSLNRYHKISLLPFCSDRQLDKSFLIIRPKNNNILVEYIHYLLHSKKALKTAQNYFGGSAGQQRVPISFLKNFSVPLPPMEIQKRIVKKIEIAKTFKKEKETEAQLLLDSINNYLLEELGIVLPTLRKSIQDRIFLSSYNEIAEKRIDPKRYSLFVRDLYQCIEKSRYEKFKLKDYIVDMCSGDWGIDVKNNEIVNGYIKCLTLRATEIDNQYNIKIFPEKVKYRLIRKDVYDKMQVSENDIIIEKSGGSEEQPVGRVAFIDADLLKSDNIAFSNFIMKIKVKDIDPLYLYYFLRTMYNIGLTDSMQSQTNGIRNLIVKEFLDQTVVVPPLDKQKEIVAHITMLCDKAKLLQEEGYRLLEEAKQEVERMIIG